MQTDFLTFAYAMQDIANSPVFTAIGILLVFAGVVSLLTIDQD